ncbi:hypothetical protein [Streptomyces sp. NPDC052496]|uniref:hypothetical protein n=1 Tax=Streptomyces sp. NPDC052496 TaxID=3154951 RepID=UPI003417F6C6
MSLPGADELFRTTGGSGLQSPAPRKTNGPAAANGVPAGNGGVPAGSGGVPAGSGETARVPAPGGEPEAPGTGTPAASSAASGAETTPRQRRAEPEAGAEGAAPAEHGGRGRGPEPEGRPTAAGTPQETGSPRRRGRGANRRPSGRERHDEKITVYVSAEELMDLEHARLVLRGEHGLAVDRGRIVREAVAVVLADLESRGDASILVRRLRGR